MEVHPEATQKRRQPETALLQRARRLPPLATAATLGALASLPALPALAQLPVLVWKPTIQSPSPNAPSDSRNIPLLALCGASDAALEAVADRSIRSLLDGGNLLSADDLVFTLRASGDPHVWPRGWSIKGAELSEDDLARRVKGWISGWNALGVRRCGIARGTLPDGTMTVAAVAIDALADMAPLPTTARVGQWLTLEGSMLVPASEVKVIVLGPRGAPKTVIASLSGSKIRSTFSVDQPGAWLVQVLATVATGPRPVLEATVFAGTTPPSRFVATPAPGEEAAKSAKDDADGLFQMVNAARASEKLAPLARDASLDKIAQAHCDEMLKTRTVGHDVGRGDLRARLNAAGLRARIAGENVASARSLENAHRALWSSPSHRENLLLTRFSRIGVAVVRAPDGSVWVAEVLAG